MFKDVVSGERYAGERRRPRIEEVDASDANENTEPPPNEAGFYSSSSDEMEGSAER